MNVLSQEIKSYIICIKCICFSLFFSSSLLFSNVKLESVDVEYFEDVRETILSDSSSVKTIFYISEGTQVFGSENISVEKNIETKTNIIAKKIGRDISKKKHNIKHSIDRSAISKKNKFIFNKESSKGIFSANSSEYLAVVTQNNYKSFKLIFYRDCINVYNKFFIELFLITLFSYYFIFFAKSKLRNILFSRPPPAFL